MNQNDFDYSHAMDNLNTAMDQMQDKVASEIIAKQKYKDQLEDCIFETRDAIRKMQEDSEKESVINKRRFILQTILSVASLIAAVVAAVAAIIALS